jgi:hypothetical protein
MALTADRLDTPSCGEWLAHPEPPLTIAADTRIWKGAVVAVNTSGYVVNGTADPTLTVLGVSRFRVDNTDGAAGAMKVPLDRRPHWMTNSASTDALVAADVGQSCYLVDTNTVARTSGGGDRPVAGRVAAVHATQGVLVEFHQIDPAGLPVLGPVVIGHADLTDGDTSQAISLGQLEPGFYVLEWYLDTAFSGGGNSAVTVIVGTAASPTNTDSALASISIFTGAAPQDAWVPGIGDSGLGFIVTAQGNLSATFTCVDGVLSGLDAGSISFRVKRVRI